MKNQKETALHETLRLTLEDIRLLSQTNKELLSATGIPGNIAEARENIKAMLQAVELLNNG